MRRTEYRTPAISHVNAHCSPKEGLLFPCVTTDVENALGRHEYMRWRNVAKRLRCYPAPHIWYQSRILHPVRELPLLLFVYNCGSVDQTLRGPPQVKAYRLNLLTPNVNYSGRTAPLTSKVAFYIFIQQIYVLNILNVVHTLRFFLFKMQFVSLF